MDFVNPVTDKSYSTVVFAGENGTGKTTILESLNSFLCFGSFKDFSFIEYETDNGIYRISQSKNSNNFIHHALVRTNMLTGEIKNILGDRIGDAPGQGDSEDLREYGSVISRPRADYRTNAITSITSQQLDNDRHESDRDDNFTSLKQLIIDIQSQDGDEYLQNNQVRSKKKNAPLSYEEYYPMSKIFRFKNAFDSFFITMNYDKVITRNGQKEIIFNKGGKEIEIDKLSTGEKQIVFRGAFLLKNMNKLKGAVIMIDEPELSMHPKWQKKILKYYQDLFSNEQGRLMAQLMVASHSEAVIGAALQDLDDTKVLVLNYDVNSIKADGIDKPAILPFTLGAEVNYQAFGVLSTDYHNALYGYMEAEGWKDDFDALQDKVLYKKLKRDGIIEEKRISLTEKIRHIIHHPENRNNSYSIEELSASIERMREYIQSRQNL